MGIITPVDAISRTLPRVRELKPFAEADVILDDGRTLPRVRELKHARDLGATAPLGVAPFPGCVN